MLCLYSDIHFLCCCFFLKFVVDVWMESRMGRSNNINISSLCTIRRKTNRSTVALEEVVRQKCLTVIFQLAARWSRACHRCELWAMKSRTLRMPLRRSFREVRARNGNWARPSNGRTASNHQHHEGPLGLVWREEENGGLGKNENLQIIFSFTLITVFSLTLSKLIDSLI